MMSYNYLDPADVGKIERPTREELIAEGAFSDQQRENNANWKGGQRTDNPKEYDRQRNKRNYVPVTDGPGKGYHLRNKTPEHIAKMMKNRRSYVGQANPNSATNRKKRENISSQS